MAVLTSSGIGKTFGATILNNNGFGLPPNTPDRQPAPFWERWPQSPVYRLSPTGVQCQRELWTPWEAGGRFTTGWLDAAKDLLGYPQLRVGPGGYYISRYLPDSLPLISCPYGDGFANSKRYVYCVDIEELAGSGQPPDDNKCFDVWQQCRFKLARIKARYETVSYEVLSDQEMLIFSDPDPFGQPDEATLMRYVTPNCQPTVGYQTLPQGSFVFAYANSSGKHPETKGTPGRDEGHADFSLTWHEVPTPALGVRLLNPWIPVKVDEQDYVPSIEDCLGAVNREAFNGCRKGTLLFTAAVIKPHQSFLGMRLWDVEYRFKYFDVRSAVKLTGPKGEESQFGHNLILQVENLNADDVAPSPPGYYEIVSKTPTPIVSNYLKMNPLDNVNIYPYRDFNSLFRVPVLTL